MSEQNTLWPFTERNGAAAPAAVGALLATPEYRLSALERRTAYLYAEDLMHGERFHEGLADLATVDKEPIASASQIYYAGYFSTKEGKDGLKQLGIDPEASHEAIPNELFKGVAEENVPALKARRSISAASTKWYKRTLEDRLLEDSSHDAEQPDSPVLYVNSNPDKILRKLEQLQSLTGRYIANSSGSWTQKSSVRHTWPSRCY